jgi:ligand-binding sensor domain-containing protein/signal transduction histidine kinase
MKWGKKTVKPTGGRHFIQRALIALVLTSVLFATKLTYPVYAQMDTLRFETISTEQGLSQSTVHAILQDKQGFMWFGTEGGLNKYDGYQFTVFKHDPDDSRSLIDNVIESVYEDRDGILWIGTNVGLDRFDPKTDIFLHYPQDLDGSPDLSGRLISVIFQDQSGILWVGTDDGGLAALDLATGTFTPYQHSAADPQSLSDDAINAIYEDQYGELWIGRNAGLDRFDKTTGKFIPSFRQNTLGSPVIKDNAVLAIYEDSHEALWFGTKNGLFQWNRAGDQLIEYRHDPIDPSTLSDDSVTCILEDSRGVLWIGTRQGLDQFDKTQHRFTHYNHTPNDPYSLASDSIRSIYEDRSGVLWIGTSGGLDKYAPATQKFSLYQNHPGLPNSLSDNNIWSIYEDQAGILWIGTFSAGLNRLDRQTGTATVFQNNPANPTSISNNEIRAIAEDQLGNLWIGMERGGLDRFDPETGTFIHYKHDEADPGSLSQDDVFSIYEDRAGRLWIGTQRGGLNLFNLDTKTFSHYLHDGNDPASLSDNDVRAIYEDSTGVLWIGTFGGIDLLDDQTNHFTVYRHDPNTPQSLSNDMVNSIIEDQNGTIWIGTFGGGLNRFDRNTRSFTHYTSKDGLPDDTIYQILADANGNLWLGTNKGLSKFNPNTLTFRNYDISDGLQGDQFNPGAFFESKNGEMFFGGTQGLNAFYPEQVIDNSVQPPVVITAFQKFNQTIQTDLVSNEMINLSYKDSFISFEFAALDFSAPEKNLYAYQLEGVDKDWVYAGTRRYASYTNLHGGDYIFRVKASNNDGVWNSEGTALLIHITPPFWQTWWFIGIVGLMVVVGGFGGYKYRVKNIEDRNRELEQQVQERTRESEQRSRVAESLYNIVNKINSNASVDEVLEFIVTQADVLSDTNFVALWLLLSKQGPFQLHSIRGEFPEAMLKLKIEIGEGMLGLAVKERRSIYFQDMSKVQYAAGQFGIDDKHPVYINDPNRDNLTQVIAAFKAIMVVPLLTPNSIYGALEFFYPTPRQFTDEEINLASAFAEQAALAIENAMLRTQSTQSAVLSERTRLARELHDSVSQLLYSVTLYAEAAAEQLDTGETVIAAGHLRELRDTAQEALREMRLLIFELHRPELGKSGLVGALQARLDAVERRGGMHSELLVEGNEKLPRAVQEELYNIAHEALNNTLKHAHANNVSIRLRFDETETEMEVCDDGVGFDAAVNQMSGGFGISGMRERAQKIGGVLLVVSSPGEGTKVSVRVPMDALELPVEPQPRAAYIKREE